MVSNHAPWAAWLPRHVANTHARAGLGAGAPTRYCTYLPAPAYLTTPVRARPVWHSQTHPTGGRSCREFGREADLEKDSGPPHASGVRHPSRARPRNPGNHRRPVGTAVSRDAVTRERCIRDAVTRGHRHGSWRTETWKNTPPTRGPPDYRPVMPSVVSCHLSSNSSGQHRVLNGSNVLGASWLVNDSAVCVGSGSGSAIDWGCVLICWGCGVELVVRRYTRSGGEATYTYPERRRHTTQCEPIHNKC
jgi:hypothetical protein